MGAVNARRLRENKWSGGPFKPLDTDLFLDKLLSYSGTQGKYYISNQRGSTILDPTMKVNSFICYI